MKNLLFTLLLFSGSVLFFLIFFTAAGVKIPFYVYPIVLLCFGGSAIGITLYMVAKSGSKHKGKKKHNNYGPQCNCCRKK